MVVADEERTIVARTEPHLERIVRQRARLQRHEKQRARASHSRRHTL